MLSPHPFHCLSTRPPLLLDAPLCAVQSVVPDCPWSMFLGVVSLLLGCPVWLCCACRIDRWRPPPSDVISPGRSNAPLPPALWRDMVVLWAPCVMLPQCWVLPLDVLSKHCLFQLKPETNPIRRRVSVSFNSRPCFAARWFWCSCCVGVFVSGHACLPRSPPSSRGPAVVRPPHRFWFWATTASPLLHHCFTWPSSSRASPVPPPLGQLSLFTLLHRPNMTSSFGCGGGARRRTGRRRAAVNSPPWPGEGTQLNKGLASGWWP